MPYSRTSKKSFVPKHLKSLRTQKKKLYKLSKTNQNAKMEYKRVEKLYKKEAYLYFASLEEKVVSSSCNKNFYNYVNQRLKTKSFIPPLLDSSTDKFTTTSDEKAELLNNFFVTCHQLDDKGIEPTFLPTIEVKNQMPKLNVTREKILNSIKKLKCSVSRTPEGVPSIFIKRTAMNMIEPLFLIFNQSIKEGKLPSLWCKVNH